MSKTYNTGGLYSGVDFKWNDSLVDWDKWWNPTTIKMNGITFTSNKKDNFEIERVIFNEPATIVIWKDESKTVVKCGDGDVFDKEKGLAMAFMKKALGNKGNFNNMLHKHCGE